MFTYTTISCNIRNMTTSTKQRITLFLNASISKQAKAQAIIEETTLTRLVEKALIKYLPKETIIKKVEPREVVK